MAFGWLMPVYRNPSWIETIIDDGLRQIQTQIDQLISTSDILTYWQRHACHQPACFFSVVIGTSVLWIVLSYLSSWKHQRVAQAPVPQESSCLISPAPSSSLPQLSKKDTTPSKEIPVHPVLIAPSPHPAGTSSSVSSLQSGHRLVERSGRISNPGYQTPFVANPSKQDFTVISKTVPASYDTLQRNDILNQDSTPTKKHSPSSGKNKKLTVDDREEFYVYDSPTRTWRHSKQSPRTTKEVQRQAEGVKALWIGDPNDGRVQHFSPAKGK